MPEWSVYSDALKKLAVLAQHRWRCQHTLFIFVSAVPMLGVTKSLKAGSQKAILILDYNSETLFLNLGTFFQMLTMK